MSLGAGVPGVAGVAEVAEVVGGTGWTVGGFTTADGLDNAGVAGAGLAELTVGWTGVDGGGIRVIGVVIGARLIFGKGGIDVIFPVGGGIRVTGVDNGR